MPTPCYLPFVCLPNYYIPTFITVYASTLIIEENIILFDLYLFFSPTIFLYTSIPVRIPVLFAVFSTQASICLTGHSTSSAILLPSLLLCLISASNLLFIHIIPCYMPLSFSLSISFLYDLCLYPSTQPPYAIMHNKICQNTEVITI